MMEYITAWWYTYPSDKYDIVSSVGMMTVPIYAKIKKMFQTTNQYYNIHQHCVMALSAEWTTGFYWILRSLFEDQPAATASYKLPELISIWLFNIAMENHHFL